MADRTGLVKPDPQAFTPPVALDAASIESTIVLIAKTVVLTPEGSVQGSSEIAKTIALTPEGNVQGTSEIAKTVALTPEGSVQGTSESNSRKRKRAGQKEETTETPLTPSPVSKMARQRFRERFSASSPYKNRLWSKVKKEQGTARSASRVLAFHHSPTKLHPGLLVTRTSMHYTERHAGQGAQAEVSFAQELLLSEDRPVTSRVVKRAQEDFEPQQALLSRIPEAKRGGIDYPLECGVMLNSRNGEYYGLNSRNGEYYGIFEKSDGDLTSIQYATLSSPVPFITEQLISIAEGLREVHEAGLIHRDVKGMNALFTVGGRGKLTDFDLLMSELAEEESHLVGTTPEYAASFIWADITDQKRRTERGGIISWGHQSQAADCFAFGVMLQRDVLTKMLTELSQKHHVNSSLKQDLAPKIVKEKKYGQLFTDEQLRELERQHPGQRIMYRFPNRALKKPGYVSIFNLRKTDYETILSAIGNLESKVLPKEIAGLKAYARLAYELQDLNPTKVMSAAALQGRLMEIQALFS